MPKIGLIHLMISFMVLKLCGVIGWSWWVVLSPVFAPIVVGYVLVAVTLVSSSIAKGFGFSKYGRFANFFIVLPANLCTVVSKIFIEQAK